MTFSSIMYWKLEIRRRRQSSVILEAFSTYQRAASNNYGRDGSAVWGRGNLARNRFENSFVNLFAQSWLNHLPRVKYPLLRDRRQQGKIPITQAPRESLTVIDISKGEKNLGGISPEEFHCLGAQQIPAKVYLKNTKHKSKNNCLDRLGESTGNRTQVILVRMNLPW